jgi:hypothetical protein
MAVKIGRHEHHILASLVASRDKEGNPVSDEEASALIGYAPATICMLRQQKAFQQLVLHYAGLTGPPGIPDPIERMRALGMSTLEELQARLHDDPDSFTKRELLEMADLLLVKANGGAPAKAATREGGVRVAIQFVEARHKELEAPPNGAPNGAIGTVEMVSPIDVASVAADRESAAPLATSPGGAQDQGHVIYHGTP